MVFFFFFTFFSFLLSLYVAFAVASHFYLLSRAFFFSYDQRPRSLDASTLRSCSRGNTTKNEIHTITCRMPICTGIIIIIMIACAPFCLCVCKVPTKDHFWWRVLVWYSAVSCQPSVCVSARSHSRTQDRLPVCVCVCVFAGIYQVTFLTCARCLRLYFQRVSSTGPHTIATGIFI